VAVKEKKRTFAMQTKPLIIALTNSYNRLRNETLTLNDKQQAIKHERILRK
jgi:hypothetical protein